MRRRSIGRPTPEAPTPAGTPARSGLLALAYPEQAERAWRGRPSPAIVQERCNHAERTDAVGGGIRGGRRFAGRRDLVLGVVVDRIRELVVVASRESCGHRLGASVGVLPIHRDDEAIPGSGRGDRPMRMRGASAVFVLVELIGGNRSGRSPHGVPVGHQRRSRP